MDVFNAIPGLGRKRLMHLNYCRLFLQIHFLSEITNIHGTQLIPGFWNGDPASRPAPPLHRYPRQTSPSPSIWQLWRSTIRKAFCHPLTTRLRQSLGIWFPTSYRRFPSVTHYPLRLWHSPSLFSSYHRTTLHGHLFSPSKLPGTLSHDPIPVTILHHTRYATTILTPYIPLPPVLGTINTSTFQQLLSSVPLWKQRLLCHLSCPMSPIDLSSLLTSSATTSSPSFLAACDGGSNRTSTFGWTLRQDTTDLATCYGPVDGHNANSYRAEATGLLSLLTFLDLTLSVSNLHLPNPLSIYIDNIALVNQVHMHQSRLYYSPTEALAPERDLLLQIEHLLDLPHMNFIIHHIRSHQDRNTPLHLLPPPAQANCRADTLATHAQTTAVCHSSTHILPSSGCLITVGSNTITRRIPSSLRCCSYESRLRQKIISSRSWTYTDFINWSFFQSYCMRNSSRLRFYIRWIHQALPTGHVLHRRNKRESPFCPACGEYESHSHFVSCSHSSRLPLKVELLSSLRKHLQPIQSDPILNDILLEGINSAIMDTSFPLSLFPPLYTRLITTQSHIGWMNLLRGFTTSEWSRLHLRYITTMKLPPSTPDSTSTIPSLLHHLEKLWQFRNAQRHSADHALHQSELLRQTHCQIRDLYQYKHSVLPTDRHIFYESLNEHLAESLPLLQAWLLNHSHYILHSHQLAQSHNITHTRPITSYLLRT